MSAGWHATKWEQRQAGRFVGVAWSGVVLCPQFGEVVIGDVEGAVREILRRMPLLEEFWFFCRRKAQRASGRVRTLCPRV